MRRFFVLYALLIVFFPLAQAEAQEAVREPHDIGASGEAYLKALRFRRIDTDVTYYDPARPAPDLETRQRPEESTTGDSPSADGLWSIEGTGSSQTRWVIGLITAAILAAILYAVVRFGGGMAVSLKRDAQNAVRDRKRPLPDTPVWAEKTGTFDDILGIGDRRRALVLLMRKVLATAVAANGILMQRSWTARDALHHLPPGQKHLDRLRDLVLASERAQFGERDVSEEDFRFHVDNCRPLMGKGAS
jgi:hypothetical protein